MYYVVRAREYHASIFYTCSRHKFQIIRKFEMCKGNNAQKTNYSLDNFYRLLPDNIKENESYIFANRS